MIGKEKKLMFKNTKLFSIIGIVLILVTVGVLFIPQFVELKGVSYNGYNYIFCYHKVDGINYFASNALGFNSKAKPSAAGIIALVSLLIAGASLLFQQKSSLLSLFGGLFLAIAGLLFVLTPVWLLVIYNTAIEAKWLAYVIGGILLAYGAFLIFLAVLRLRDEKNALSAPKSHQYSYIKK